VTNFSGRMVTSFGPGKWQNGALDQVSWSFTYQLASMHGAISIANKFPSLLGGPKDAHGLAHGAGKGLGAENKVKWDFDQIQCFAYLLNRLSEMKEGDGSALDSTCLFYGSSNSKTHNTTTNYPLVLIGGSSMVYQHGQYPKFENDTPLSNLFVTIQNRMGATADTFADSNGSLEMV